MVKNHRDQVKDTIIWEVERGLKLSAADIAHAQGLHSEAWDRMRIFLEKYEYFIAPSTQVPPFDVTQPYVTGNRRRADEDLHGVDEMLLVDLDSGESVDFHAVRLYAGGFAGGFADCRAASG